MKNIIIFILTAFFLQNIAAQYSTFSEYGNPGGRLYTMRNFNGLPVETKGCPYFNDESYVKGEVQMIDTVYKKGLSFRYDQIIRTLQVKFPNGKEAYLLPDNIVSFKLFIDGKTFLFERIQLSDTKTYEFLQVIYSSSTLRLLRDSRKKTRRENVYDLYTSAPKDKIDYIENDYRYYLSSDDIKHLKKVEPNKKSFAKVFPQKTAFINGLFNRKEYRIDLTISKLAEIASLLDEELKRKEDVD
jgi:hypothetical protein